jgi:hypothetical protein
MKKPVLTAQSLTKSKNIRVRTSIRSGKKA